MAEKSKLEIDIDEINKDKDFFCEHIDEFIGKYGPDTYVAIHKQKEVGHGENQFDLTMDTSRDYKGPFYVECPRGFKEEQALVG